MPRFSPVARIVVAAVAGVIAAGTMTASVGQASAVAPYLEAPMQLSSIGQWGHSAFPSMTRVYDGSLRLVFREGTAHASPGGRIIMAESHDDGQTWVNPQTIRGGGCDWRDPSISSVDGSASPDDSESRIEYLTWFGANPGNPGLGAGVVRAWGYDRRIDTLAVGAISAPITKLPDGRLAAVYYGKKAGESTTLDTAWMGWSSDGGWSWETNRIVNMLGAGISTPEPYPVVNGGMLHVLYRWGGGALGIRSSWDSGKVGTWDQPRKILDNATGRPTVIATAGTMVVVYREASTGSAAMAYSVDNGQSWQTAGTVLPAPAGGMMTYATMVAARDNPKEIRLVVGMEQAGGKTSQLWDGTVILP